MYQTSVSDIYRECLTFCVTCLGSRFATGIVVISEVNRPSYKKNYLIHLDVDSHNITVYVYVQ